MKHASHQLLRKITVHVEEPRAGAFRWALGELVGSRDWQLYKRGTKNFPTYHEAMAAGLIDLEAEVPDLDRGPRVQPAGATARAETKAVSNSESHSDVKDASEPAADSPHALPRKDAPGDMPAPASPRRTVFGFGLIS